MILFGYWQMNLGDDLMLEQLKNIIHGVRPNEKIRILTQKKYKKYYKNLGFEVTCTDNFIYRIINRVLYATQKPELFFWKCNKKEIFVMLGGSLFAEHPNDKVNNSQYINLKHAINNSRASFVIGSNFGPYNKQEYLENYMNLFQNINDICFRDMYSKRIINKLGVRVAPDIVFNLKYEKKITNSLEKIDLIVPINTVGRPQLEKYTKDYKNGLLECIKMSLEKNHKVFLISFCEKEGDNLFCEEILKDSIKLFGKDKLDLIYYQCIDEILDLFKKADTIYATRFHAMILGLLFGKRVFPIIYSSKMINALNDYCHNVRYVEISNFNEKMVLDFYKWTNFNILKENIIVESEEQFKEILKYIQ